MKLEFSQQFFEDNSYKLKKVRPVGAVFFPAAICDEANACFLQCCESAEKSACSL